MVNPTKNTPHKLRHGQTIALQYAVQILLNMDRDPRLVRRVLSPDQLSAANAVDTTVLGCQYAARIMLPFCVEVALKALIAKHGNDQAPGMHSLCQLYDALPTNVQAELNRDFENTKCSVLTTETRTLQQILSEHDNDFPNWRYLDEPECLLVDPIDTLQYIACSVLNVYNST